MKVIQLVFVLMASVIVSGCQEDNYRNLPEIVQETHRSIVSSYLEEKNLGGLHCSSRSSTEAFLSIYNTAIDSYNEEIPFWMFWKQYPKFKVSEDRKAKCGYILLYGGKEVKGETN